MFCNPLLPDLAFCVHGGASTPVLPLSDSSARGDAQQGTTALDTLPNTLFWQHNCFCSLSRGLTFALQRFMTCLRSPVYYIEIEVPFKSTVWIENHLHGHVF